MNLVRAFFPNLGHFSLNFEKGQGRPLLPSPSSYAPGVKLQIFEKNPQVHLIIIREWPKNSPSHPLILRNLDDIPPGAFDPSPPLQLGTKE